MEQDRVEDTEEEIDYGPGLDPERLRLCLEVIAELDELHVDHPDAITVRQAVGGIFRTLKQRRRQETRARKTANDRAVTARTATGAPTRIDDETAGAFGLTTVTTTEIAGILERPRSCYTCKQRYVEVDAFYHNLCQKCAVLNRSRRDARADLTGKRALLTGGRAKIGMYIALMLLRDGAHTTITTRFPNDAIRRFTAMPDSAEWIHRLKIIGIDLRDPAQVMALADEVAADGPLDILINNAAQTVRRPPESYRELLNAESAPLPAGELPQATTIGRFGSGGVALPELPHQAGGGEQRLAAEDVTSLALVTGSATPARIEAGTAIDAGGLVPDLADTNSWVQTVSEVGPVELLEVQLCNSTAPFILISRLRPAMAASASRRKYVVNVSAMEGVFARGYKGAGHPHTNMAKAALNMLTRTSAQEMFESDGILMTAVDTGWITDERPHPDKMRLAEEGFHAPLDLVDGAARVYDPIVRGEQGEDLFGCFLKDYERANW
ncbi:SDR family NAD(P)-dependent oxidoreductase [Kitasatospora xanthocidica]|uniref:SDR family NAD(P)-dependent oxidoreductase n=1 Tax=Kitasatospora xanthocidica TaxID=83382 RepID=UPI001E32C007|nr:SDR family NAD(P)-dependent oxidoreductase [Kitasatospora xanthocidica]